MDILAAMAEYPYDTHVSTGGERFCMPNKILDPDLKTRDADDTRPGKDFIYCARCSTVIGRISDRTEVNGSFDHHCTNPHGINFHVGCFSQALGCAISGPVSYTHLTLPTNREV